MKKKKENQTEEMDVNSPAEQTTENAEPTAPRETTEADKTKTPGKKDDKKDKRVRNRRGGSGLTNSRDLGPVSVTTVASPVPSLKTALVLYELQQYKSELVTVPVQVINEQILFSFRSIVERFGEGYAPSVSDEVLLNICNTLLRYHNNLGLSAWTGATDKGDAPVAVDGKPVVKPEKLTEVPNGAYINTDTTKNGMVKMFYTAEQLDAIKQPLKAVGLPDAAINHIITAAIENLDRLFIRNVFTPSALRAAMEKDIITQGALGSIESMAFDDIVTALQNSQKLYAAVCKIKTLDSFGESIVKDVTDSKLLSSTFSLLKTFHEWDGPSAPMELESVLRELHKSMSFAEPLSITYSANGLVGRVTGVAPEFNVDFTRADLIAFIFELMKTFGGLPLTKDGDSLKDTYVRLAAFEVKGDQRYAYKANPLVLGRADKAALYSTYVSKYEQSPSEVLKVQEQIKTLFVRFYVRRYCEMIIRGESGTLAARLTALIDQRALSRNESWDYLVQRAIQVQSIVFQSFVDTFNLFLSLVKKEDVYFKEDTRRNRTIALSFLNDSLQYYKTSTLPADHPAAIKDIALLFSSSFCEFTVDASRLFFAFKDSYKNAYKDMVYDPVSDTYQRYYLTMPESGTILDAPEVIPRNVLLNNLTKPFTIDYALVEPFRSIFFETQAGSAFLKHPPLGDLLASDHFGYFEDQYGQWKWYLKPEEMARELGYPLPLAKAIFDSAPKLNLQNGQKVALSFSYDGPNQRVLFLDRTLLPMYEIIDRDEYFRPVFRVSWPYSAKIEISGFKQPLGAMLQYMEGEKTPFTAGIDGVSWKSGSDAFTKPQDGAQDTASQYDEYTKTELPPLNQ